MPVVAAVVKTVVVVVGGDVVVVVAAALAVVVLCVVTELSELSVMGLLEVVVLLLALGVAFAGGVLEHTIS